MKITRYKHGEDDFWNVMGPFFVSRTVRKQLGMPMSSDEQHTWFIAMHDGTVAGFAAVEQQKNGCILRHIYVVPEHRTRGLMKRLIQRCIKYARTTSCSAIRVTVSAELMQFYAATGWIEHSTRGQYHTLSLDLGGTK